MSMGVDNEPVLRENMERDDTMRIRRAYTLIELLLVITMILVLMGMFMGAYHRIWQTMYRAQAVMDASQMSLAVQNMQSNWQVQYVPSYITIKSQYDLTNAQDSFDWGQLCNVYGLRFGKTDPINSNLRYSGLPDWGPISGSQCLVLFLGGTDGVNQFGTGVIQSNTPFQLVQPGQSRSLWYDFKPSHLWLYPGSKVPYHTDPFQAQTPFVYMTSTFPVKGDYNYNPYNPNTDGGCTVPSGTYTNTVTGATQQVVGGTVSPYMKANKMYWGGQFQIISAGENGQFGPGGLYSPGVAPYIFGTLAGDDMSSFSAAQLSVPQ